MVGKKFKKKKKKAQAGEIRLLLSDDRSEKPKQLIRSRGERTRTPGNNTGCLILW